MDGALTPFIGSGREDALRRPRSNERRLTTAAALCAADVDSQGCLYARMLQAFPAPFLIICGGRVHFKNRAANRLIAAGVLTIDSRGVAHFADPVAQYLLERVRSQEIHSGAEIIRGSAVARAAILQVMRIGRAASPGGRRSRADIPLAVLLTPLADAGAIRRRAVDGLATLSKAEKEVLSALVNGDSVSTIAEATQRSIATVRWHVKKLLTKTGARSIGDLTRIGSLLAPY